MMARALIAMSGGVDSSAAALLMKNAGYDCAGAVMRLCEPPDPDAERVCRRLGIPFYEFDFSSDFNKNIVKNFVNSYKIGETPNPCIDCNKYLKFGVLHNKAMEMGFDFLVTGHYARTGFDEKNGRYFLKKGLNQAKDQSYVLYNLTQELLSRVKLPLGDFSDKDEIRKIAEQCGLDVSSKHDSQDICFVPDGDYARFIEEFSGTKPTEGNFVQNDGKILGRHKGLPNYTVGQRKGLGIAYSEPLYVLEKRARTNEVVVGTQRELLKSRLVVREFNLIMFEKMPEKPFHAAVRTRYHAKEAPCEVRALEEKTVEIRFEQPQRAASAGQSAVLYDGDYVIGGGIISECT